MEVDFYSTLESVREKIERGEKYYALLNDKSKWNQYYLTEILFIKLGNLEKYAEEIDKEFRIE